MSEKCEKIEAIDVVDEVKKNTIPFDIFFMSFCKNTPGIKEWHKKPMKVFCESFTKTATVEEWLEIIKRY